MAFRRMAAGNQRRSQAQGPDGCGNLHRCGQLVLALVLGTLVPAPATLLAADTNAPADSIPPLRPPGAEIPPSLWEQHGALLVLLGLGLILGLATIIWIVTRPKPPQAVPPAVLARGALGPLAQAPETGEVLSKVSQILRQYIVASFELPPGELTTTDLRHLLAAQETVDTELREGIVQFLARCDYRKFAPTSTQTPLSAVPAALKLIEQCEVRHEALRQSSIANRPTAQEEPLTARSDTERVSK
jgi:hypothetical protein